MEAKVDKKIAYDAERLELALAYAAGKITADQAASAMGMTTRNGNTVTKLATCMLAAIRGGILKVERTIAK